MKTGVDEAIFVLSKEAEYFERQRNGSKSLSEAINNQDRRDWIKYSVEILKEYKN